MANRRFSASLAVRRFGFSLAQERNGTKEGNKEMEEAQDRLDAVCRRLRDLRTVLRRTTAGLWDITQHADRIDRIIQVLERAHEDRAAAAALEGDGQGDRQVEAVGENREENADQQRRGVVRRREEDEVAQEDGGDGIAIDGDDGLNRMRRKMRRTMKRSLRNMR
ncbi:hypothetical protein BSKO_07602 [Bryopsis sp. KO-2023]|nr:hypothetical protein BSKO_07602 [Bryopsis sp. KO-2023]